MIPRNNQAQTMSAGRSNRLFVGQQGIAIGLLYALDGFVLGQGFVALALLLATLLWLTPKWLLLKKIRRASDASTGYLAVSFLACSIAIMLTINLNNQLAWARANSLVAAIDHYRLVAGRYPTKLDDLVPTYIDAIPRAKYTLSFNQFDFANRDGQVMLAYADTPPFGRVSYDFKAHRWQGM